MRSHRSFGLSAVLAIALLAHVIACATDRDSAAVDSSLTGAGTLQPVVDSGSIVDGAPASGDSAKPGTPVENPLSAPQSASSAGITRSDTAAQDTSRKSAAAQDTSRKPAATQDTTAPKARRILVGPRAGAKHMAFRDAGSPLDSLWPVKTAPAPLPGSILPEKRIIAFYGNPLSKRMGILGEFIPDSMLRRLDTEVAEWNRLDPEHPVQPALHLIAMVADGHPGPSGKYRTRMDSALIEKVYGWAKSRNAIMFVDLQVGQSTIQAELPWIEKFLVRPDVHLGMDPEFSMKKGGIPGQRIGTYDAADINYAIRFLADLVTKYDLPPKVLVIHRFTPGGVTNYQKIELDPRVQVVMHMDGFGAPWLKRDTYWRDIKSQPVQYTGWKQFSKTRNDNPPTPREDILRLWPVPLYIQIH
jgi:hypothetical protein